MVIICQRRRILYLSVKSLHRNEELAKNRSGPDHVFGRFGLQNLELWLPDEQCGG